MPARNYFHNESLARTTSANTSFSAFTASLTFTGTSSVKYAVFWCAYIDVGTIYNWGKARLQNTTTATTIAQCDMFAELTTARISVGGVELYTGTGSAVTIRIEYCSAVGTVTTGISESSILALELGANDIGVESTGDTASSSTSYATKVTTGSFGSAGDYLIIGSAKVLTGSSSLPKVQLNDGTTALEMPMEVDNGSEVRPYFALRRATFSGAQTHTLDFGVIGGTHTIRNARLFAFRISDFDNCYWDEDRVAHTTTSATYADSTCVASGTPLVVDHVVLASGQIGASDMQVTAGGNKINDGVAGAGADLGTVFSAITSESTSSAKGAWIAQKVITPTATAKTWTTRYNRTAGSGTTTSDEHVIAVLQLDAASGGSPMVKRWGRVPYTYRIRGIW